MPFPKQLPTNLSLWRQNEEKAKREGLRKTIYDTNGEKYTGEWRGDKREGKGTCVKKGRIYEGDWENGKRQGYGIKSVPRNGEQCIEYTGGWKNDKKEGYGTNYYANGQVYEGEFFDGLRSGWGRMTYNDGSIYEGEWLEGKRYGTGLLVEANGNRYEGEWSDDAKHGDGRYYHLTKGQLFTGTWVAGTAKCGEMEDLERQHAPNPTVYPLPELGLKVPAEVLQKAREEHLAVE
eukprot:m.69610 g.69610  ORF g.69610 m.69610 type:complete len:234 (+) comp16035_c0_seq1:150-851(+)